jgi:hypothetical protein
MLLRDDIAHHRKFLVAGDILGESGAAQALALWIAAIGYARRFHTDGYIDEDFVRDRCVTFGGRKVADVLCSRRVRLFHRVKGGYVVHDFGRHNGTSDKLQRQRELAAARKRKQRAKVAVENLCITHNADAVTPNVTRDTPRDTPRDSRARDKEKEKEVRTDRGVRATALVPVPPETDRTAPQTARHRHPTTEEEQQRRRTASRAPAADGNYAVLEKLAHSVLEERHTADAESPDVVETLKVKCKALAINYHTDPQIVRRALVSAATQRVRAVAGRVDRPFESVARIAQRVTKPGVRARR